MNLVSSYVAAIIQVLNPPKHISKIADYLSACTYMSTGFYFSSLDNEELKLLLDDVYTKETGVFNTACEANKEQAVNRLGLLAYLLLLSEGISEVSFAEFKKAEDALESFILDETRLRLKTGYTLDRSNYSLFNKEN